MKRLTTYYFLLLAGLSAFFAQYVTLTIVDCKITINDVFEGQALPLWTEWAFQCTWWLWIGVAICIVGVTLSLLGKPKDNVMRTLLAVFLIVELCVMFFTMVAFHLPFRHLT